MNYKITIQDNFSVLFPKIVVIFLSEVHTIIKPKPFDDTYTFLDEKGKMIYCIPSLYVISIRRIKNNKKKKENEDYGMANDGFPIDNDDIPF